MFGLFKKDPVKKLRQQYDQKLEQAMLDAKLLPLPQT